MGRQPKPIEMTKAIKRRRLSEVESAVAANPSRRVRKWLTAIRAYTWGGHRILSRVLSDLESPELVSFEGASQGTAKLYRYQVRSAIRWFCGQSTVQSTPVPEEAPPAWLPPPPETDQQRLARAHQTIDRYRLILADAAFEIRQRGGFQSTVFQKCLSAAGEVTPGWYPSYDGEGELLGYSQGFES